VNLDEAKSRELDAALERYLGELKSAGEDTAAVTLGYTHSLHRFWRPFLRTLSIPDHWTVLDVGSGLGLLSFELAANLPLDIEGIDIEATFVEHSRTLQDRLSGAGLFSEGSAIAFTVGDVRALEFGDESFDLVFVRELLQFLPDPVQAVEAIGRVLRPGGYLCISDTDDGMRITWPASSPALERLVTAVAEVQHERGGDRETGRKLTSYLRSAGFEIQSLMVLPEAQHRLVDEGDAERALIIEQLHAARGRVLAAGALDAGRFDSELAALEREAPFEQFRMNARLIVLGQKPATD
jgi:ubiquinone/menaquinone biosynthesis C-methylase UbiE